MFLVALRHGQTDWNSAGRFQGYADPPLDQTGWEQAERVAADLTWLIRQGLLGFGSPEVISSDLQRAASTAQAVARVLGSPLTLDPALREVDLGRWAGLDHEQARERFPEEYQQWKAGLDVRRGGGETASEAGQRVASRVEESLAAGSGGPLIVVSHGVALKAGLEALRALGIVTFTDPAPHLENGHYFTAEVVDAYESRPPQNGTSV